jgi:hypothetical protein
MLAEDRKTQDFPTPPPLADAELVALIVPFDEPISSDNPSAPLRYTWGDLPLPRKPLPLREEHDGREIGLLDSFVVDRTTGIWARVKGGRTATALIARGWTAISAEIDDGKLTGAALVPHGYAAFASARLFGSEIAALASTEAPPRFGLDPATGMVAFRPPAQPSPAGRLRPAMDLGAHRREHAGWSMAAVHAEAEDRGRQFRERREELAQQDLAVEETRLIEAGVPTSRWPRHLPGAQRWAAYQQREAAIAVAEAGELAAADFAQRMARLEAAARAARPWYRRWFK